MDCVRSASDHEATGKIFALYDQELKCSIEMVE